MCQVYHSYSGVVYAAFFDYVPAALLAHQSDRVVKICFGYSALTHFFDYQFIVFLDLNCLFFCLLQHSILFDDYYFFLL